MDVVSVQTRHKIETEKGIRSLSCSVRERSVALQGDAGGAMVCRSDDQWVQAGVVSLRTDEHSRLPPFTLTRVTSHMTWITRTVQRWEGRLAPTVLPNARNIHLSARRKNRSVPQFQAPENSGSLQKYCLALKTGTAKSKSEPLCSIGYLTHLHTRPHRQVFCSHLHSERAFWVLLLTRKLGDCSSRPQKRVLQIFRVHETDLNK